MEPDEHWAAFQKTADAALVQHVAALELNGAVKPYREWTIDPRWAGFFKDFRVRMKINLAPNGRVRDAFLSIRQFMRQSRQSCLYFTLETVDVDSALSGTVFQVRCCCAVLLFIVLIRVQNGKAIGAKMHFAAGDLVLKRSLTRPTRGFFLCSALECFPVPMPGSNRATKEVDAHMSAQESRDFNSGGTCNRHCPTAAFPF